MTTIQKALQDCITAMEAMIRSRDSNCFKREQFIESDLGAYWSPSASMIDSDTVAKGRTVLEQAKQALANVPIDTRWAGIDFDRLNAEMRDMRDQIGRLQAHIDKTQPIKENAEGYAPPEVKP
jgi:hypothetical protein